MALVVILPFRFVFSMVVKLKYISELLSLFIYVVVVLIVACCSTRIPFFIGSTTLPLYSSNPVAAWAPLITVCILHLSMPNFMHISFENISTVCNKDFICVNEPGYNFKSHMHTKWETLHVFHCCLSICNPLGSYLAYARGG